MYKIFKVNSIYNPYKYPYKISKVNSIYNPYNI